MMDGIIASVLNGGSSYKIGLSNTTMAGALRVISAYLLCDSKSGIRMGSAAEKFFQRVVKLGRYWRYYSENHSE
jgi:hypothetical protein